MLRFLFCISLVLFSTCWAEALPPNAIKYLPVLVSDQKLVWPDNQYPYFLAGQVEQETCLSLKSKGCWNPNTQLKTDREYGFGLYQVTITSKFNNFDVEKSLDKRLNSWKWEDRFDPKYQIIGGIDLNKVNYAKIKNSTSELDKQAFSYCAYNGGLGGLLQDRKLCGTIQGCNSNIWFGNVELHSFKSKIKAKGYGQSFFDVNRGYVKNVLQVRSDKYKSFFK